MIDAQLRSKEDFANESKKSLQNPAIAPILLIKWASKRLDLLEATPVDLRAELNVRP